MDSPTRESLMEEPAAQLLWIGSMLTQQANGFGRSYYMSVNERMWIIEYILRTYKFITDNLTEEEGFYRSLLGNNYERGN